MYLLGLSYRCNDISKLNLPDFDHLLSDMHFSDLLEIETALLKIETDLLEIETNLPEIKIALPEIEIHTWTQSGNRSSRAVSICGRAVAIYT